MWSTRCHRPGNASRRDGFLRFNTEYPGDWHLRPRRLVADGGSAALLLDVRVGDEQQDACVWLEMSEQGLINKIIDYWPEPYDPPQGREHLVERSWANWPCHRASLYPGVVRGPPRDSTGCGNTTACAAMTRSPSKVSAGEPYS